MLSGGLDSLLAAKIVKEEKIGLIGVSFKSYFFDPPNIVRKQAEELGIPLKIVDISQEQLALVLSPRYGFGKGLNPCRDCHALMLKKAKEIMEEEQASFLVTGDVLGQRPFSQNLGALKLIEGEAGAERLVLRPLSAKLLPPTLAEERGLILREKLYSIKGKQRKEQLALAKAWGLKNYQTPAGGCLLTDPAFSQRLKDLLRVVPRPTASDLALLKLGRHFWDNNVLFVVGRNEEENERLKKLGEKGDYLVELAEIPGPTVLARSFGQKISKGVKEKARQLVLDYAPKAKGEKVSFLAKGDNFSNDGGKQ